MEARKSLFSFALLAAAAAAPAQYYVVDAANGPGTDFTTMAAAIAAVPDGAVLVVRPGSYLWIDIDNKDLTVLGGPGVEIWPLSIRVRNLAAGKQVTLHGLELPSGLGVQVVQCTDNVGMVLLDDLQSAFGSYPTGTRLEVTDCADVRVRNCSFDAIDWGTPLSCTRSNLRLVETSLRTREGLPGCQITDSTVEAVDVSVRGASGAPANAPFHLANADLRLFGGSYLRSTWSGSTADGPAITGAGTVRIDPDTTLVCGTSPPIGVGVTATWRHMPAVTVDVPGPFGVVAAVMTGPTDGIGALWLGLPGPPVFVTPFEDAILIEPGSEYWQAMGSLVVPIGAGYVVPPHPLLLGVQVTWQGASIDPVHGVQIGNAVTYVHG